ncbi:MAG: transposase, partial [Bacteroidetes bacterium]|nr:transposase [Bacteroidota bacterium]
TRDVKYLIKNSCVLPYTTIMDKGYDDNNIHAFMRDRGICSVIPVRKNCVRGQYRKEMRDYFDYGLYWQRNIAETLISCIKRRYGASVSSRNIRSQRSDLYCRMILYNVFLFIVVYFH